MVATITKDEQIEVLEKLVEHMGECARLLQQIPDRYIQSTCLAEFEGQGGDWEGGTVRDLLERKLEALRSGQDTCEEEAEG